MSEVKIALVTGASSGIGRAVAQIWGEFGAHVVTASTNPVKGEETVDLITNAGGSASFVKTDVAVEEEVAALFEGIVRDYGRLDWACNNAGIVGPLLPIAEYPVEDFDRVLAVNLRGVFLCLRHELPIMTRQHSGSIVNICSESSIKAGVGAGPGPYTASKHAVHGLTKKAALEVAQTGVRVNAVAPGIVRTAIVDEASPEQQAFAEQIMPSKRFGHPREIAEAVAWLASDAASLVNGHMLVADSGLAHC